MNSKVPVRCSLAKDTLYLNCTVHVGFTPMSLHPGMVHCTELVTNGKETQTVGERSTVVQRGRHKIITILHAGCSMIEKGWP